MEDVLRRCETLVAHQLQSCNIALIILGETGLAIHVDPFHLQQILMNLIANAIDAMPQGGRITLRVRRAGAQGIIEVSDTGEGIPPEMLDRIMEPFVTTRQEGSGLGLPICAPARRAQQGLLHAHQPARQRHHGDAHPAARRKCCGMTRPCVLIIDDEANLVTSVAYGLDAHGFHGIGAGTAAEGLDMAGKRQPRAILLDQKLPDGLGIDLIAPLRVLDETAPIIMISAHGDIPTAVEAVRRGAYDFVTKPFELDDLVGILRKALAPRRGGPREKPAGQAGEVPGAFQIEVSPVMRELRTTIEIVARSTARIVLLLGASGVGKGFAARAVHEASARAEGPFIVVNCASLPGDLLEAELFGVEHGALGGTAQARPGLVEAAQGGSLFLDEIGDISLPLQAKLLRFLETRCYRRLGASREQVADIRVIAASNKDLGEEVEAGRFRADLFYRLNVVPVAIPRLADHAEDVLPLARHFAGRAVALESTPPIDFSEEAAEMLADHDWPGNVRELANLVERLTILYPGRTIEAEDLPPEFSGALGDGAATIGALLEDTEREILVRALRAADGHKGKAADALGISRHALKRRLKRVGMA